MAQEKNGHATNAPSVITSLKNEKQEDFDSLDLLNLDSSSNGHPQAAMEGNIPSENIGDGDVYNPVKNKTVLCDTDNSKPNSSPVNLLQEYPEDLGKAGEQNTEEEQLKDSVGAILDQKDETASKTEYIEAISLIDIKASFTNEQEPVQCDGENSSSKDNDLSFPDLKSDSDGTIFLTTEDSKLSSSIGQDTLPVSSDTNSNSDDGKHRDSKLVSNYEIQPGELTNQLIEGPSITLPSSELSNRISSLNTDNTQTISGEHSNGTNVALSTSQTANAESTVTTGSKSSDKIPKSESEIKPSTTVCSSSSSTSGAVIASASAASAPAPAKKVKKTPHDFIFGKVLGEGSYSTVYLAKEVSTQREFAVKVCEKKHLIREHKTHFVMREKEVLMKLDHPFFIKLAYTFQDPERLYYVLTYARNGELLSYLNKLSVFDVPCTRFYTAEVVIALEYLQSLGIVHRDLKPENILLGDDMHIKITDFGTSKILNGSVEEENKAKQSKRKNSFVGTAEYVTPEVLNGLPANYGTDLWALACIIYQCLSSSLPFRCGNEYQTFQRILRLEYEFPEGFNKEAKDLVQKILVTEPTERLGMKQPGGMQALKEHPFFEGIEWENLATTTPPKLLPYLPATANNPEFWGGQEQRTGFDDQRLAEIITGQSVERCQSPELEPISVVGKTEMGENEWTEKIDKQRQENEFHQFVENNLILRQGFVDKRKGLFARKRMLLLTEGPHLYYVDAHNKVLKGEIPWSKELRSEAKNFKIFFVHTPNRTYYLESRNPDAHHWVKRIQEVWNKYYGNKDGNS